MGLGWRWVEEGDEAAEEGGVGNAVVGGGVWVKRVGGIVGGGLAFWKSLDLDLVMGNLPRYWHVWVNVLVCM